MKENLDMLGESRKISKTPNTMYSLSTSPVVDSKEEMNLIKDIRKMQILLAKNLEKYAENLNRKVKKVLGRRETALTKLEFLQLRKKKTNQALQQIKCDWNFNELTEKVENQEKITKELKNETKYVAGQLSEIRKKNEILQGYTKKLVLLQENSLNSEKNLKDLVKSKEILIKTAESVCKYRNKIMEEYNPMKSKLEEIMISKEELILSLPLAKESKKQLENRKEIAGNKENGNSDLKNLVFSLKDTLEGILAKNQQKREEIHKQTEKVEGKFALARVQQRFLKEKQARLEVVSQELNTITQLLPLSPQTTPKKLPKSQSKSAIRPSKIPQFKSTNKSLYK